MTSDSRTNEETVTEASIDGDVTTEQTHPQQVVTNIDDVSRAMTAIHDFEDAGAYERDEDGPEDSDSSDSDSPDAAKGSPKSGIRGRIPIVLVIAIVAGFIITVTSLGLQWMARHGGGTGDPVEASSEVDNTPIPLPHVTEVGMVSMSFPTGMSVHVASGKQWTVWDGQAMSGTLQTELANQSEDTITLVIPTKGTEDLIISFTSQEEQPFLSFSASMLTKENGLLMMTGAINNLPHEGTARIIPIRCHVGVTNMDEKVTSFPVINTTVSYTVGDGNADYVGSYVSCSALLTLDAETTEAYLTTGTREVKAYAPKGFGHGDILQAGRTTVRQNGMQTSTLGTVTLSKNKKEFSGTYKQIAESDQSNQPMGQETIEGNEDVVPKDDASNKQ